MRFSVHWHHLQGTLFNCKFFETYQMISDTYLAIRYKITVFHTHTLCSTLTVIKAFPLVCISIKIVKSLQDIHSCAVCVANCDPIMCSQ